MGTVEEFIAENLLEARTARGINQVTLARMVDSSSPQISKFEKGLQKPSSSTVAKICTALSMPLNYFLTERLHREDYESTTYYRSMAATTKQQRLAAGSKFFWLGDIYQYVSGFIEFPNVNLPKVHTPCSPELISKDFIEEIADLVRDYWGLGDAPIDNLTRLLENNGFIVSFFDLEADTLDAFSRFYQERPFIIVGTQKATAVRVRFNLAHELGHLILHKNLPPGIVNNTTMFKLMEEQAHRFASAFIFPQSAFFAEIPSPDLPTFKLRKARWKLAISAMIFRGRDLGLIDEDEEKQLRRSYGKRRWREFEPLDESISTDFPELLSDAFRMLVNEGVQSKVDILESLDLPGQDIENLAGLERGFLKTQIARLSLKKKVLSIEDYAKARM